MVLTWVEDPPVSWRMAIRIHQLKFLGVFFFAFLLRNPREMLKNSKWLSHHVQRQQQRHAARGLADAAPQSSHDQRQLSAFAFAIGRSWQSDYFTEYELNEKWNQMFAYILAFRCCGLKLLIS